MIPENAKRTIDAFLQQEPDEGLSVNTPEDYGYEFQSQSVIERRNRLLDKFIGESTVFGKEEMNPAQAFDMLIQALTAQLEQATQDRMKEAKTKVEDLQTKADTKGWFGWDHDN